MQYSSQHSLTSCYGAHSLAPSFLRSLASSVMLSGDAAIMPDLPSSLVAHCEADFMRISCVMWAIHSQSRNRHFSTFLPSLLPSCAMRCECAQSTLCLSTIWDCVREPCKMSCLGTNSVGNRTDIGAFPFQFWEYAMVFFETAQTALKEHVEEQQHRHEHHHPFRVVAADLADRRQPARRGGKNKRSAAPRASLPKCRAE